MNERTAAAYQLLRKVAEMTTTEEFLRVLAQVAKERRNVEYAENRGILAGEWNAVHCLAVGLLN